MRSKDKEPYDNILDADGITSTGIVYNYLSRFTDNIYIVYNERSKGHSVSNQLDQITDDTDLIIILDSSSNEVESCKYLSEEMDVIILDHHQIEQENPYAILVNPQNDDYPNKGLSGAGVCYKFIQSIDEQLGEDYALEYRDLVAVGMIGDMMPLDNEENRRLIVDGLNNFNNIGLISILEVKKKDINNMSVADVAYGVSPLLNGTARLNEIKKAIDILTTNDVKEAKKLAKELNDMNEKRKKKEIEIFERIKPQAYNQKDDKMIVVIDNDIDKGFNGLIATKIVQEFHKPALVLQEKDKTYGGSGRTFDLIPFKSILNKTGKVNFVAGHEQAFGISFKKENIDKLISSASFKITDDSLTKKYEYDLEIKEEEMSMDDVREIEEFSRITGHSFPAPRFKISNLFVNERNVLGKNTDTIKISCDGLDLMKFKTNDRYAEDVNSFDEIDTIGTLNINKFYNWKTKKLSVTIQMFLDDWKFSE